MSGEGITFPTEKELCLLVGLLGGFYPSRRWDTDASTNTVLNNYYQHLCPQNSRVLDALAWITLGLIARA